MKREISSFLVTFINIYALLLGVSILLALFIASHVTKPMKIMTKNLEDFRLGQKNKKINWGRQDEIGELVHQYNQKIDELEKSAEKLSRSERENAWREMARQVAHEIKNPLTPMKLSVQHLEKAWE